MKTEIFLQMGLDRESVICPSGCFSCAYDHRSVILRCAPPSARLEGWCSAQCVRPSFEARKKERAPQDDGAVAAPIVDGRNTSGDPNN